MVNTVLGVIMTIQYTRSSGLVLVQRFVWGVKTVWGGRQIIVVGARSDSFSRVPPPHNNNDNNKIPLTVVRAQQVANTAHSQTHNAVRRHLWDYIIITVRLRCRFFVSFWRYFDSLHNFFLKLVIGGGGGEWISLVEYGIYTYTPSADALNLKVIIINTTLKLKPRLERFVMKLGVINIIIFMYTFKQFSIRTNFEDLYKHLVYSYRNVQIFSGYKT